MARRMLTEATGILCVIEIDLGASSYTDFLAWRIEARNLVDYRRRQDRWWAGFCMVVWRSADSRGRGIVRLGSLTTSEVVSGFDTRWATTLRPIGSADLRSEILAAIDPDVIAPPPSPHGRYQSLKFSMWPRQQRVKVASLPALRSPPSQIEPMPVVI